MAEEREREPVVLTRAVLENGFEQLVTRRGPDVHRLSDADRARSLRETLAARPGTPGEGVWLFAYGSLIWNPALLFAERRLARVAGWHRAFCLASSAYRGTPERPGLVLGLDAGGHCDGVAYRIDEGMVEAELALLWRREMLQASYVPRWVMVSDPTGAAFAPAIAFTIDRSGGNYVGRLPEGEVVRRLATARGQLGTGADYLFRTRDGLRGLGIEDRLVERLAEAVARTPAAGMG